MELSEFDRVWTQRLQSDRCPTILGLAPLSEVDCDDISILVKDRLPSFLGSSGPIYGFLKLLREHGAVLSVWLARKAGIAYDGGFWERFEQEIGFRLPQTERRHFANEFRRASARSMVNFTVPEEHGPRKFVAEFLFQAGLPLHHCGTFARHMERCGNRFGLPDPDDPEAAGELRDQMVHALGGLPHTVLLRALRGPAGPALCGAALRVVVEGRFDDLNPRLGKALSDAFRNWGTTGGGVSRAARRPFLRLSNDLCGLEIVGPRQEVALVAPGGISWVLNGVAERAPADAEFVRPVPGMDPVSVELRGLRAGVRPAARRFAFRWEELAEPFILFDATSRRQLASSVGAGPARDLRGGRYYLLHRMADELEPAAADRWVWPDGGRALSTLEIRPGDRFTLTGGWSFGADRYPFLEVGGRVLLDADGRRLHYGWDDLPAAWLPAESLAENGTAWRLTVRIEGLEETWPLAPEPGGQEVGGMRRCRVAGDGAEFLLGLKPGLRPIEATVLFGQRRQTTADYLLWIGLETGDAAGERFTLSANPGNLRRPACAGYGFVPGSIVRETGGGRQGMLTFGRADGGSEVFRWHRSGTFLESFERVPGRAISSRAHALGERFAASVFSRRELRVWPLLGADVELLVNGVPYLSRSSRQDGARYLDLGLANLAALHPRGGALTMRSAALPAGDLTLATFVPPLTLETATATGTAHTAAETVLRLRFTEAPGEARPLLRNLLAPAEDPEAGGPVRFETPDFEPNGTTRVFRAEGLPALILASEHDGRTLGWTLPRVGWPLGLWHFECQVRRDAEGEWQVATDAAGRPAPVLLPGGTDRGDDEAEAGPVEAPEDWPPRARLLWTAAGHGGVGNLTKFLPGADDALDLLTEITAWARRGFVPALRGSFGWLDGLREGLEERAGELLNDTPPVTEAWTDRLLHLACREDAKGGLFVRLPGLLALPAALYRQVPVYGSLAHSLRWCAEVATSERIVDGLRANTLPLDLSLLGCRFSNFNRLAMAPPDEEQSEDLAGFDYFSFWRDLPKDVPDPAPDNWDGLDPLGATHWRWAVGKLTERYESTETPLGAVNALLLAAPAFLDWLFGHLNEDGLAMLSEISGEPWPTLRYPEGDFIENVPPLASLVALAARAAAAGWIPFGACVDWLSRQRAGMEALPTFVQFAPELFGHQLMFWELMIQSHLRANQPQTSPDP